MEGAEEIYNKFMDSKLLLANFGGLDHREWVLQDERQPTTLVHSYTGDQFVHETLNYQSRHFYDVYRARAMYRIPHTPQVILPDRAADNEKMELLVERGSLPLEHMLLKSRCEGTFLSIVKTVLRATAVLAKKYGYFRLTPKMIRCSRSDNLLVWFHEYTSSNFRQFPILPNTPDGSKTMILDIFSVFQENGPKRILSMLRDKVTKESNINFQKIMNILDSQISIISCLPEAKNDPQKNKYFQYKSPDFLKKKTSNDNPNKPNSNDIKRGIFKRDTKEFQKININNNNNKIVNQNQEKEQYFVDNKRLMSPPPSNNFLLPYQNPNQSYRNPHKKGQINRSLNNQKQTRSERRQTIEPRGFQPMAKNRWASNQLHSPDKDLKLKQSIKLNSPVKIRSESTKNCFNSHSFINQHEKLGKNTHQSNTNTALPQKQIMNVVPVSPAQDSKTQKLNNVNILFKNSTTANLLTSSTQNLMQLPRTPTLTNQASEKYIKPSQKTDSIRKPSFRDSGNSLATTNFLNSINSSGRTKLLDEQSSFSLSQSKSGLLSSCGEKQKCITKQDNRFTVKASKIIEEYSEDWVPNSVNSVQSMANTKSQRDLGSEFDLQKDLDSLLWSDRHSTKRSVDLENQMKTLESQIKNILDF